MSVTSDYIKLTDALALAEELYVGDAPLLAVTYNDIQSLLKAFLKQVPNKDAIEVIRCKDCKYNTLDSHNPNALCRYGNRAYRYGFCHEAERRNDG